MTYLTQAELAKRWKLSKRTIARMIRRGQIKKVSVFGRSIRIPVTEIERVERTCTS